MKLYTEEQVREMLSNMLLTTKQVESIFEELTPIELPSDEDISKEASNNHYGTNFKHVFANGAKWMRDKIIGKEDKTFKQKSKWTKL